MLCVPPWRQAVFANLVAQGAQADAQHLGGVRSVAIGQRQSVFQVQLSPPARSECPRATAAVAEACGAARGLRLPVELHLEAAGIDLRRLAQGEQRGA